MGHVDAAERREILARYIHHSRRFDEAAARRNRTNGELVPLTTPPKEFGQAPTGREIQVLQLISDGLANRESANTCTSRKRP